MLVLLIEAGVHFDRGADMIFLAFWYPLAGLAAIVLAGVLGIGVPVLIASKLRSRRGAMVLLVLPLAVGCTLPGVIGVDALRGAIERRQAHDRWERDVHALAGLHGAGQDVRFALLRPQHGGPVDIRVDIGHVFAVKDGALEREVTVVCETTQLWIMFANRRVLTVADGSSLLFTAPDGRAWPEGHALQQGGEPYPRCLVALDSPATHNENEVYFASVRR